MPCMDLRWSTISWHGITDNICFYHPSNPAHVRGYAFKRMQLLGVKMIAMEYKHACKYYSDILLDMAKIDSKSIFDIVAVCIENNINDINSIPFLNDYIPRRKAIIEELKDINK